MVPLQKKEQTVLLYFGVICSTLQSQLHQPRMTTTKYSLPTLKYVNDNVKLKKGMSTIVVTYKTTYHTQYHIPCMCTFAEKKTLTSQLSFTYHNIQHSFHHTTQGQRSYT